MMRSAMVVALLGLAACGVDLGEDTAELSSSLVLVDSQSVPRTSIEVGESLLVSADKLDKGAGVRVVVRDGATGKEVLSERLVTDNTGALLQTTLWPDIGLGHAKSGPFSFASLDDARAALGGHTYAVELYDDKSALLAKSTLTVSKDLVDARIYPSDAKGVPARALSSDSDLVVSLRNLPPKSVVDAVLVREQADWQKGDPITAVRGVDGSQLVMRVQLDSTGSFTGTLAKGGQLPVGRYQIITLPGQGAYLDRPFDPGIARLSDRLLASVLIRPGGGFPPVFIPTTQMSGHVVASVPGFEFTDSFEAGGGVMAAIDPSALGDNAGRKVRFYVIPHRDPSVWGVNTSLADVTGHVVELVTRADAIGSNRVLLWANPTPGDYDIIADFGNQAVDPTAFVTDARLDSGVDLLDGFGRVGFRVGPDPSQPGIFPVGTATFTAPDMTITDPGLVVSQPVNANLRYPATSAGANTPISTAHASYPLVVVMHGQGLPYDGYDYLLDQLASQGYVAAEIECDQIPAWATDPITDYARCLLGYLPQLSSAPGAFAGHLDLSRVAVVGHSRGGDGVVRAETLNRDEHLGWNLRAVISLAPTDGSHGALQTPFLGLYGSNDNDVGMFAGFPFGTGGGTAFRIYDRAVADKAMVFIRDANHDQFSSTVGSDTGGYPAAQVIQASVQQNLARGYITAFLRWKLDGRADQRDYFAGNLSAASGAFVRRQFEPLPSSLRLVDDFSGSSAATNALGGAVSTLGFEQVLVDVASTLERTSPNSSRVALMRWNGPAVYTTAIPSAARNVQGYATLSLRVGQTYGYFGSTDAHGTTYPSQLDAGTISSDLRASLVGDNVVTLSSSARVTVLIPGAQWQIDDGTTERSWVVKRVHQGDGTTPYNYDILQLWRRGAARNHTTFDQTFRVRLTSADGAFRDVDVGTNEAIAYPNRPVVQPEYWDFDDKRTLSAMQTVRIPLSAFTLTAPGAGTVDLTNVVSVQLIFGNSTGTTRTGEVLLDDLAFGP